MGLPSTGNLLANNTGLLLTDRPTGKNNMNPVLAAFGTWGGGTLKMQAGFYQPDGVTINWADITGVSLTANGYVAVPIRAPVHRLVLSGATSPNLNWHFG